MNVKKKRARLERDDSRILNPWLRRWGAINENWWAGSDLSNVSGLVLVKFDILVENPGQGLACHSRSRKKN